MEHGIRPRRPRLEANLRRSELGTELTRRIELLEKLWADAMQIGAPTLAWRERGESYIGDAQHAQGQLIRPGVWLHKAKRFVPALEIIERCGPFKKKKPNKSLALASRGAGLNGVVTPRDLRTMFISAAGAADQVAAARLGGHKDISTTNLYLKSTDDRAIEATIRASKTLRVVTERVVTEDNAKRQMSK